MRYFLKLSYDGTPYHGWQRQPNANSVQQTIEEALSLICREEISIVGAGRTDTGVHASRMYAHFDFNKVDDKKRLLTSLNNLLGRSIAVEDLIPVTDTAHARFDAILRIYHYYFSLIKNPFRDNFSTRLKILPDIEKMNEGCEFLLNTDDFTSFAKLHSDTKTNICKVSEAYWSYDSENQSLKFVISADRFLRNMVRAVTGTLLELGLGKISLSDFEEIIKQKNRCAAGNSMPAKGLFLSEIVYPKEIFLS